MMELPSITCAIAQEVDIYVAVGHGREMAVRIGFSVVDRTRIEIVILELARNLVVHAKGGRLVLTALQEATRRGMRIEAIDQGPGIANIELAMQDGYSTTHTLGAGLPSVQRLMDEFLIESTIGTGTYVKATKWLPKPREGTSL